MELHKLLVRQLARQNLSHDELPNKLSEWQEFIDRINKAYIEADQERYILERSMEVSSRELFDLNRKLESAQQIAQMGYWELNLSNNKTYWSKELYHLHGLDPSQSSPDFEAYIEMVHPDDRNMVMDIINNVCKKKNSSAMDVRGLHITGEYRWFHITMNYAIENGVEFMRGTSKDITDRKKVEKELELLQQQIVESARYAGMAEIASSTLHNIGNVLNSANVSVELIKEFINKSEIKKFNNIQKLLDDNQGNIFEYLHNDEKGKLIPEYLIALLQNIKGDHDQVSPEIDNLARNINHIKDIISTQTDISRSSGISQKVYLPEIIDNAVEMAASSFEKEGIKIEKEYQNIPIVWIDKVKLIQILVNLVRNAKDAVQENDNIFEKKILISLTEDKPNKQIKITVNDNGIGILPENITKMFSSGFTTKKRGHGLGLHMSALHAKELGGSLLANSKGLSKGATFTLTFPKVEEKEASI